MIHCLLCMHIPCTSSINFLIHVPVPVQISGFPHIPKLFSVLEQLGSCLDSPPTQVRTTCTIIV